MANNEVTLHVSGLDNVTLGADDGGTVCTSVADGFVPANGTVSTEKVVDGAITTPKIADGAVTMNKIKKGAVTDDRLDPNGVISKVAQLEREMESLDVTIDPDDLGLEQDPDTFYVYPTYRGVRSENGIPLASSGGGGGGGSETNAKFTANNTSGWLSRIMSVGGTCPISVTWSSIEDEIPTGDGTLTVKMGEVTKLMRTVSQGEVTFDVSEFLGIGNNKVKVRVADVYDQGKTFTFTVNVVELRVSSNFDTSGTIAAGQPVTYTYTPVGAVSKNVRFLVDGEQVGSEVVTASGYQQSYQLPAMAHGAHVLEVYFTADVEGQTVTSNRIRHSLVVVNPSSNVPIIASAYNATEVTQYDTLAIPYTAYTPTSLTTRVTLKANGETVTELTVDRTEQLWSYRCDTVGSLTLTIQSGTISKSFELTVAESDVHPHAETNDLVLNLGSYGRSNNEEHPEVWEDADNDVSCTLTGFNFVSDGWVTDSDGITALRVANDARVTIPYKPFAVDFRGTGKTIELEFATRNILNYDAVVVSCMSGGRGFELTAQKATLASEQSTVSTQYKEDEHVRIAFVVEKRSESRLLFTYINGIMSGVVQYPDDDDFSQMVPVDIQIGSNSVTTDVYHIRVYDNDLTRRQVLDNWVADAPSVTDMLARYRHNDVYDEYGSIVISKLPTDLPYMVLSAPELPQFKGDKKPVDGYFVDPSHPERSFSFEAASADVQGTSSQYYPRKNYKIKFSGFTMTQSGEEVSKIAIGNSVPTKTFTFKADVASSEGANNVELVRLYERATPYKTPPQESDSRIRQGIDGFPMVMFWDNGTTVSFVGKYNFNHDKGTEEVFGFADGDESWEILNNNSLRTVFKDADFSGDGWKSDFEGRYPDGNEDVHNLAALVAWLVSTDREQATGDALSTPYTDVDGTSHTVDDAAYRLAKFKTEAPDHLELDSACFYYLFTELFLMVDSRAKNAFPSFFGTDKWSWLPYDMDSALGIDAA